MHITVEFEIAYLIQNKIRTSQAASQIFKKILTCMLCKFLVQTLQYKKKEKILFCPWKN